MGPNSIERLRGTWTGELVKTVSTRLTEEENKTLAALAKGNGCSKGALMRAWIREGLQLAISP